MMWYRIVYLLNLILIPSNAFVTPGSHSDTSRLQTTLKAHRRPHENLIASTVLASSLAIAASNPLAAQSYVPSDYASETVQEAVQALKAASGNIDGTFKAYETIAEIITEGKGVGGMVNYSKFRRTNVLKVNWLCRGCLCVNSFSFLWQRGFN